MTYMHKQSRRASLLALAAMTLFGAGVAQAQTEGARQASPGAIEAAPTIAPVPHGTVPCPMPIHFSMTKNSGPGNPLTSDFPAQYQTSNGSNGIANSVFNQTQMDKWFGTTFRFKPGNGACCSFQPGQLKVVYKSLGGGGNDGSALVHNGAVVGPVFNIWGGANTPAGTQVTHTFTVPASDIASGHVSLWAQDDTAVVSATLTFTGCCLEPTRPQ